MDIIALLLDGFIVAFQPLNLLVIIVGVIIGLFIGAMPGLGSVNGVAILLPMTFLVPPASAIIFLAALYYGAMYGGAISSIMLGIPGASTAVATTFDGRPLALKGKADKALITAAMASFIWGYHFHITFYRFRSHACQYCPGLWRPRDLRVDAPCICNFCWPQRR